MPTLLAIALFATVGIPSATVVRSADDSVTSTTTADVPSTTMVASVSDARADSTTTTTIEGTVSVPDGVHVIDGSPAGSVTVAVKDSVLSIVSVDIAGEWSRTETEVSAREIEVEFENEDTELKVNSEIDDGRVTVRAEFKIDEESGHGSDGD